MPELRYILYARKSTEDKEKQVNSIPDQLFEARKYAKEHGLNIVATYSEEKSAFHADIRTEYYKVICDIESGKANAILTWDFDRLARNPKDRGIYENLLHEKILKEIATPQGDRITSNTVETGIKGIMNYEKSVKISEDVKRGMRNKVMRGEYPRAALLGYDSVGEEGHRNIVPNTFEAPIIKTAFQLAKEGFSMGYILRKITELGLRTKYKKHPLSKSQLQYILKNTSYYGVVRYNGEDFIGTWTPIIRRELFLAAQAGLQARSKPKLISHGVSFTGLIRCGNCGCSIVTTVKTKYVKADDTEHVYYYYRCSRKRGDCNQPPINDQLFQSELLRGVSKVTIDKETLDLGLELFKQKNKSEELDKNANIAAHNQRLESLRTKVSRLIDMKADGLITTQEFISQKAKVTEEIIDMEEKLQDFNIEVRKWFELAEEFLTTAHYAQQILESSNFEEKLRLLKKLGSNYILKDKKLDISFKTPYDILASHDPRTTWLPD